MSRSKIILCFLAALVWSCPVSADDEASVEAEAMEIADTLHCMVCSDPNIETAQDEIAKDLKAFIRRHLNDGKPQELVINLVLSNYGEIITRDVPPLEHSGQNEQNMFLFLHAFLFSAALIYIFRKSRTFKKREEKEGRR